MRYRTRTLAVFNTLALSVTGPAPVSRAIDAYRSDSAQSGQVTQPEGSGVSQVDAVQPQSAATQPVQPTQPAETSLPEGSVQSAEPSASLVDTTIPDIQAVGGGGDSAMVGAAVTTVDVVVAAYPVNESGLSVTIDGYTIQTPSSGGTWEPGCTRSGGLLVYAGKKGEIPAPGACVHVTGMVGGFPATSMKGNPQSLTQLATISVSAVQGCRESTPISATRIPTPDEAKALESMLLALQGTWIITDNHQMSQYDILILTPGESPPYLAMDVVAPGQAARDYETVNAARAITFDDGTNMNLLKGTVTKVTYAYSANSSPAHVSYRVSFTESVALEPRHGSLAFQPTSIIAGHPNRLPVTITGEHPDPLTADEGTRVATFSVSNYFSDLGVDESGCSGYPDRAGAFVTAKKYKTRDTFSREALANQEAKIVSVINALGADMVALEKIGSPVAVGAGADRDATLARLAEVLSKTADDGMWACVPPPPSVPQGEDVIRIAFIYRPATITPIDPSLIHDDLTFTGLVRQPLAQEFARVTGQRAALATLVIIGNHFKSKGSVPGGVPPGSVDSGNGQGNANTIRVARTTSFTSFVARFADKPALPVGDFNSYLQGDPIKALEASGWARASGADGISHVYTGRSGSLNHVFSNATAKSLLSRVTSWAVNAQESIVLKYSRTKMNAHLTIEADNPYRSSDHNPEIIGLTFLRADDTAPSPTAPETPAPSETPSPAP